MIVPIPFNKKIFIAVTLILGSGLSILGFYLHFNYKGLNRDDFVESKVIVENITYIDDNDLEITFKNNNEKYLISSIVMPDFDIEKFENNIDSGSEIIIVSEINGQKYNAIYEIKDLKGTLYLSFDNSKLRKDANNNLALIMGIIFAILSLIGLFVAIKKPKPKTLLDFRAIEYFERNGFNQESGELDGIYNGYKVCYGDNIDYFNINNTFFYLDIGLKNDDGTYNYFNVEDDDDYFDEDGNDIEEGCDDMQNDDDCSDIDYEVDHNKIVFLENILIKNKKLNGNLKLIDKYDGNIYLRLNYRLLENSKQFQIPSVTASVRGLLKRDVVLSLLDDIIALLQANNIDKFSGMLKKLDEN